MIANKVFKLKKNTTNSKGDPSNPPVVVDANLNTIPSSVKIGNGSKVIVDLFPFSIEGTKGVVLMGVQVLNLVPFASSSRFEKREGFVVDSELHTKTTGLSEGPQTSDPSPFE